MSGAGASPFICEGTFRIYHVKDSLNTEHPTYLRLVPVCVHSLHIQVDGLYSAASEKNNSYVYKHSG